MRSHCLRTIRVIFLVGTAFAAAAAAGCGGILGDAETPVIAGCNSVYYRGAVFSGLGCEPGIASFDVFTTQGGSSARFHITCAGGCVSSATPLE